jgi:vacuolar-type H+-ATPase subunit I/STV1
MWKDIDSKVFVQLDQVVINQLVQSQCSLVILLCFVLGFFHFLLGYVVFLVESIKVFSLAS